MPNNDNVLLHVTNVSNPAWTSVTGTRGNTYYYKYTGGNITGPSGNNGNNEFQIPNPSTSFEITLQYPATQSYKFPADAFKEKVDSDDLSGTNTATAVTVTNTRQHEGEWEYGAEVEFDLSGDPASGETFDCDPVIYNRR